MLPRSACRFEMNWSMVAVVIVATLPGCMCRSKASSVALIGRLVPRCQPGHNAAFVFGAEVGPALAAVFTVPTVRVVGGQQTVPKENDWWCWCVASTPALRQMGSRSSLNRFSPSMVPTAITPRTAEQIRCWYLSRSTKRRCGKHCGLCLNSTAAAASPFARSDAYAGTPKRLFGALIGPVGFIMLGAPRCGSFASLERPYSSIRKLPMPLFAPRRPAE